MIFPRAKSQSISTGFLKIKNTLTVACKSKDLLDAFDFLNLTLDTVHGIKCKLCEKDADIEIVNTDISAEEYSLNIANNGVLICASDLSGAIYAASSLVQLIKNDNGLYIPCQTVLDTPYTEIRGVHFYMPQRSKIDEFKRIIDSMAFMKMNTVILEVGGGMQYDRHPEINEAWVKFCKTIDSFPGFDGYKSFQGSDFYWKDSVHTELAGGSYLTKDEVRDIVKYCKSRGMNVIPEVQGLSHSYYLTIPHPEIAELQDDPFPDTYCPNNEESYRLYFDVAEEVIEVFEPTTVSIGHDEIRVLGWCDRCKGKSGHELVGKEIARLHSFYAERGIRIAMWAESAQTFVSHKGSTVGGTDVERYNKYGQYYQLPATNKSIEYLPDDILMLDWYHSIGPKSEECFDERGFDVIYGNFHGSLFGEWDIRSDRECIRGAEVSSWCPPTEEIFARDGLFYEMMFSSYILWCDDYSNEQYEEVCNSIREAIPYIRTINKGHPSALVSGKNSTTVYLGNQDSAFSEIDLGEAPIYDDAVKNLLSGFGKVYGVSLDRAQLLIKKEFKADSVFFLHSSKLEMPHFPSHYFKDENTWGIGSYAICYEDGTVETANVYYGRQIGVYTFTYDRHRDGEKKGVEIDMDIQSGAEPTLPCYYTEDYTWGGSLTYNTTPIIDKNTTAFLYEWRNPHPEKKIIKIRPYHIPSVPDKDGVEQSIILYAILAV